MWQRIMVAASADISLYKDRIVRTVLGGMAALVAIIILLVSSTYALCFWVAMHHGPLAAYLSVLGAAIVMLAIGLVVAWSPTSPAPRAQIAAPGDARLGTFANVFAIGQALRNVAGRTGLLRNRSGLTKAALGALAVGLLLLRRD